MLFNSWTFVIFVLLLLPLYYGCRRMGAQVLLLTVASYVFYGWHCPWLVLLLLGSTALNVLAVLRILQRRNPKTWAVFGVAVNVSVLAFFKYAALLGSTFLPPDWWAAWGGALEKIPLPLGISFFTFKAISMIVDLYRANGTGGGVDGLAPPRSSSENWVVALKVAFFKSFFPALVMGPIVKAHEFMYQIGRKYFASIDWEDAVRKLVLGFFFKMVVADNLKDATAMIVYPEFLKLSSLQLLLLLYGYSFQIFADFYGYSLIAMGLARLFGYQLPINFNRPYLSGSISEFWRRWHISLSTWLKEYLYFPLGGNRKGKLRTYANVMIVMLIGGIWHGASWNFMLWGGFHGLFLALERMAWVGRTSLVDTLSKASLPYKIVGWARIFAVLTLASIMRLTFQLTEIGHIWIYVKEIARGTVALAPQVTFTVLFFSLPVIIYHLAGVYRKAWQERWSQWPESVRFAGEVALYGGLFFMILTNSGTSSVFIYFQF